MTPHTNTPWTKKSLETALYRNFYGDAGQEYFAKLKEQDQLIERLVQCVNAHEALKMALGPFVSGGAWGAWKAWLVNGAPTKDAGIAAAALITRCQVAADIAMALAEGKTS